MVQWNIILYERKRSYWKKNTTHFPSFNSHDFWEEGSSFREWYPPKKISQNSLKNGHIWKAAGDPPFPNAKTASLWAARFCGGRVRLGRSGWTCMDHWSQAKFKWRLAVGGCFFKTQNSYRSQNYPKIRVYILSIYRNSKKSYFEKTPVFWSQLFNFEFWVVQLNLWIVDDVGLLGDGGGFVAFFSVRGY